MRQIFSYQNRINRIAEYSNTDLNEINNRCNDKFIDLEENLEIRIDHCCISWSTQRNVDHL